MPQTHAALGFNFLYPDGWKIESEDENDSFTVESPTGAFLSVSRFEVVEGDEEPIDKAKRAMEEEYDEIEQEYVTKNFSGVELIGLTQRFVYLDLIITSSLLTFESDGSTYLLQVQAEDRDSDTLGPVFDAIMTSMCESLNA